jgi:lipoprotein signal peptidase
MSVRVTNPQSHLGVLARIALLVAIGDWLTKAVAARVVGSDPVVLSERLRFAVVHNDGTAFGLSAGAYTWPLNLALTLVAIVLMVPVARDLARIDDASPRALGLIMGGAMGNLASLLFGPPGVVDFISVSMGAHSELVLNVADIAAYAGLAMMLRTGFLIVGEMRRSAQPRRVIPVQHWVTVARRTFSDREVPRPVAVADRIEGEVGSDLLVPRPESVRRAELIVLAVNDDPRVIDIRPHLNRAEMRAVRPAESDRFRERVD